MRVVAASRVGVRLSRSTLAIPGLPRVLGSIAAGAYGQIAGQLTLSWAAFEVSQSELAISIVFALRMLPLLLLGLAGGHLSDRVDRWRLVIAMTLGQAALAATVAAASMPGELPLVALFTVSAALGGLDAIRTSATQALVYDLAGREKGLSAIATANLVAHLIGFVAGLAGGVLLARFGLAGALGAIAATQLASVVALLSHPRVRSKAAPPAAPSADPLAPFTSGATSVREAFPATDTVPRAATPRVAPVSAVLHVPLVRLITAYAVATEVLAFSAVVLLPAFADQVFDIGPGGLGVFYAARACGGVAALLALPRARRAYGGNFVLSALGVLFGAALIAFAVSPTVVLACIALAAIGAAGAAFDALNQALLAEAVPAEMRGAAMGAWVAAIGSAPFGHIEIGALAVLLGPVAAQSLNGLALVLLSLAIARTGVMRHVR